MSPARTDRRKIAIIGSGSAGLGAAWALKDTDYDVHIFEKSSRLGGHTNTQPFASPSGETINVDTGFIVMNAATYPNFIRFLREVGVDPVDTEMTFGVSRDHGAFEWSGEAQGIFAQRRNFFRPRHWRMIFDIIRFNQFALDLIVSDDESSVERLGSSVKHRQQYRDMPIGDYLEQEGYSHAFRDDYLIPMTAAVWSTSPDKASLDFPAQTLIRFMWNHHLLSTIATRPPWMTIMGGSQRYIDAIVKQYPPGRLHIHTSCEVANILRPTRQEDAGVTISWVDAASGRIEGDVFDHAILACHGDQILPLLAKHGSRKGQPQPQTGLVKGVPGLQYVSELESEIFSTFETSQNICYLHSDLSLMPRRRATWTAWNYLIQSVPSKLSSPAGVSLTYNMNILQHLPESRHGPVLVTMNPPHAPDPAKTQGKFIYRHPLYTIEAVQAQKRLEQVQNARGVSYAGAWTKYGFHEDGFSSGLKASIEHLGAKLPFEFVDSTYARGHRPELGWKDYGLRIVLLVVLVGIRLLETVLGLPVVRSVVPVVEAVGSRALDMAEAVGVLRDPVDLRKARVDAVKRAIVKSELSKAASGIYELPAELQELIAVLSAQLEGQVPVEDQDLIEEYVERFKANPSQVVSLLQRNITDNANSLAKVVDPDIPPPDIPTHLETLESSIATSNTRISQSRQTLAYQASELHALNNQILTASIRLLEQSIHGAVPRATKAQAEYLALVAEGMSKKLAVQHAQVLAPVYDSKAQTVLKAKTEELVSEERRLRREREDMEEKLGAYRKGKLEGVARQLGEIGTESERVRGEIERLKAGKK
nr:hypothetical protein B0A51_15528 [Rachicladosporium sp. CCFEE 5018]